jgi:Protein  of unknown function (DUF3018)
MEPPDPQLLTPHERRRQREAELRSQGLRPMIFWVPDVHSPEFAEQAHRDSLAVANSPFAKEDQDFVDSISVFWDEGWDEDWNTDGRP